MSKAITPIDLDLNKQQLLDHSNSGFLSPLTFSPRKPSSSNSSSSFSYTKCDDDDSSGNTGGSGPVIENDDEDGEIEDCEDTKRRLSSIYNSSWLFTNEHIQTRTPSRKDGISYVAELDLRRNGTTFIRDLAKLLKLKPICKETAYVYFHRFYMLRSFKQFEPTRISMACLYFACKFEDHPTFKEYMVKVGYFSSKNEKLNKDDKKYIEQCDQLINDENLLLQTLGFQLQVRHSQVIIVEASHRPIQGTTQELYTSAYQIASEINRLLVLCLELNSHLLACVAIYLTAYYKRVTLPNGWYTTIIANATEKTLSMVSKVGDSYKEILAKNSQIIKKMINESAIRCESAKSNSMKQQLANNSRGQTSSSSAGSVVSKHASSRHSKSPFSDQSSSTAINQHFINNFSPDSAYSSCSSTQSPQENPANRLPIHQNNGSGNNGSNNGGHHHYNNGHNNNMMNYHHPNHHPNQQKSYSGTALSTPTLQAASSNCYANSSASANTITSSSNIYNNNNNSSAAAASAVVPNKSRSNNNPNINNNNNIHHHHSNNTLQQYSLSTPTANNNNSAQKRNISHLGNVEMMISNQQHPPSNNNLNKKLKPNINVNHSSGNNNGYRQEHSLLLHHSKQQQQQQLNYNNSNNHHNANHHNNNNNHSSSSTFMHSNSMKFNVPTIGTQQSHQQQQQMMAAAAAASGGNNSYNNHHNNNNFYHHHNSNNNSSNNNNNSSVTRRSMTQF